MGEQELRTTESVQTADNKKVAIQISHVSKAYDNGKFDDGEIQYVLDDISIDVHENEFVCVLGPSGCGKSTLLNMIAGYIKPTKGQINIFGEKVTGASGKAGVVFQEHALMPWLTVKNNILMGPKLHGISRQEREEIARKYIAMVGLEGMEDYYPRQLSGGMAQRVGIARALANNPRILLMDEPLGALDAMTRANMRKELLRIFEQTKITIFFITHSVQEAIYLADRVVVLKNSKVMTDVPIRMDRPRDMKSEEFLKYIEYFEGCLGSRGITSD